MKTFTTTTTTLLLGLLLLLWGQQHDVVQAYAPLSSIMKTTTTRLPSRMLLPMMTKTTTTTHHYHHHHRSPLYHYSSPPPTTRLFLSSLSTMAAANETSVMTPDQQQHEDDNETNSALPVQDEQKQSSTAATTTTTTTTSSSSNKLQQLARQFCNLFPVWTVLTAATALYQPSTFAWISPSTFSPMIGLLMLCMGISLTIQDFVRVLQRPAAVAIAIAGCYGVMPTVAVTLSKLFLSSGGNGQPPGLAAGLILVSAINGAQASNLCTYIGQGDLALSILMTTMTTVSAVVMTPVVAKFLLGTVVPVQAKAVAWSTAQVVLVPILTGMLINAKFPGTVQKVLPYAPILGIVLTCLLVGSSVSTAAAQIVQAGAPLQWAAFLLHAVGGIAGYGLTKPFYTEKVARTFGIQFAMKSSAFGYVLACQHFAHDFFVRVPSAVSIVYMTLIGSSMAVLSRMFPPTDADDDSDVDKADADGATAAATATKTTTATVSTVAVADAKA